MAQSHVQDGPLFRDVDFLAAEHGIDARLQAGFLRQLQQQLEAFAGDAILRVVEVDPDGLGRHPLAALGIVGEQLPEMEVPGLPIIGLKSLPSRAVRE